MPVIYSLPDLFVTTFLPADMTASGWLLLVLCPLMLKKESIPWLGGELINTCRPLPIGPSIHCMLGGWVEGRIHDF